MFQTEYNDNWAELFQEVRESDLPTDANIIRSHVGYMIKTETNKRKLKARLCPYGNEDNDRYRVRKYSLNAQVNVVRLLIYIFTFLQFYIGAADIKGAYLQSRPIKREGNVRPPRELHLMHKEQLGVLCKFLKVPYGIVEAGREWMLASEAWMLTDVALARVTGISQIFVRRDTKGKLKLLANLMDDVLDEGKREELDDFIEKMSKQLEIRMIKKKPKFLFA